MMYHDINQVSVSVADKVREYYRVDKKLGGLIKVFVSLYIEKLGREVSIVIPELDRYDVIKVNGHEWIPKEETKS